MYPLPLNEDFLYPLGVIGNTTVSKTVILCSSHRVGVTSLYKGKLKRKKCIFIKPISKKEAMYLKENGYEDCVQKVEHSKSYFIVEEIDEYKYENGKKVLTKTGALTALENYRKSITTYSYFSKTK